MRFEVSLVWKYRNEINVVDRLHIDVWFRARKIIHFLWWIRIRMVIQILLKLIRIYNGDNNNDNISDNPNNKE